jgi:hypothetical protein
MLRFQTFFARTFGEKLAFLLQNTANFGKFWIITMAFKKNAFFSPKITEIIDHGP